MTDIQTNNIPAAQDDEISLKELILKLKEWTDFLLGKWKLLLLAGILGGAIGVVYAYLQKPIYTAALTYALEDEKSGGGLSGAMGLASSLGFDLGGGSGGGAFAGSNLMELMHSRSLIEKTLLAPVEIEGKTTNLVSYYITTNELNKGWEKKPELANLSFPVTANRAGFTRVQDSVLGSIYSSIATTQLTISQKDKKVSIGTIEVKSEDEIFAKKFCESLVKEVTSFYVDTKSKKAKINVAILEKQSDSIRAELNAAITGVAVANDNTFSLNPALNVKRSPSAQRQVDVQANSAILTQLVANLEMAKVSLRKETPLVQIIDAPILPLKKEKVSKLKSLILGGFLCGFLVVIGLVGRRVLKGVMG